MEKYGQIKPPTVPVEQISVPTGLFVGTVDNLATVADNDWLAEQLNESVLVHHSNYVLDHLSFSLAADMSYFTVDVMNLVNRFATNSFSSDETSAQMFITN